MTLRVLKIMDGTSVDGPGLRTSIYLAGCNHFCQGCHNPQSWDMNGGTEMTIDEVMAQVDENDFNVTLSGGDPLMQIDGVIELVKRIKAGGRTVWCYTGYTYEEVASQPKLADVLNYIDVLVDGPYQASLRDISLRFRGSSNQRLVDVAKSAPGNIILWQ